MRFRGMRYASLAFVLAAAPLQTGFAKDKGLDADAVETLQPGEFLWLPDQPGEDPLVVVVSLRRQLAYVYRGKRLIGASTVSSGSAGHTSPVGRFAILEKQRLHKSNRYSEAPMPWMQRLNWYGVALHGGNVPGYPASHGCIRLPIAFAKTLFEATQVGAYVFVTDDDVRSPKAALKLARRHAKDPMSEDRMLRGSIVAAME